MTSVYDTIRSAMEARQQIVCLYSGHIREVCFHTIGFGKDGEEKALGYQFAGGSSKGLPVGGEWRCFTLSSMSNVHAQDGKWYTSENHSKPQSCVKDVRFEVLG